MLTRTITALCSIFTLGLQAQTTSTDSDQEILTLDPLTVSTSKLTRTLFDSQESISVTTSAQIENRSLKTLEDVLNQTANITTLAGEGFSIRGIAHNSVVTGGSDGELASYYIDGVAYTGFAKRFGPQNLWDVEQVEILRGPQSTNVGRNALAGAISIRTKDPANTQHSALRLGLAEYDTRSASAMFNTPVGDQSALRLTIDHNQTEGWVSNPTRNANDYDARENTTARAKWLWTKPDSEQLRVLLTLQYGDTRRGQNLVSLGKPDARENYSNLDAHEDHTSWSAAADVTAKLNEQWTLTSITSKIDADYSRFDDDDLGPGGSDAFRGGEANDQNWAEELRFGYANGAHLRGVIGLFYTEVDRNNRTTGKINIQPALVGVPASLLSFYPTLIEVDLNTQITSQTANTALFTEWEYDLADRWTLFGGARYDHENQDRRTAGGTSLISTLPNPATPGLPPIVAGGLQAVNQVLRSQVSTSTTNTSTSFSAFLPQGGITYEWSQDLTTGFLVKRGYRSGGAELNLTGRLSEYDPEFITNYELSMRSRWMDGRATLSANLYYGDWQDQQVRVQQSANTLDVLTENAGQSEIHGAEIELTARLNPRARLFASYGYAHTKFRSFQSNTGNLSGNQFALAPENTFATGGTFALTDQLNFHTNITYQGEAFADAQNTRTLDAHTLVNLRFSYDTDKWSARLYAQNLFDELYLQSSLNTLTGAPIGVVGAPRVIGFEFTTRF